MPQSRAADPTPERLARIEADRAALNERMARLTKALARDRASRGEAVEALAAAEQALGTASVDLDAMRAEYAAVSAREELLSEQLDSKRIALDRQREQLGASLVAEIALSRRGGGEALGLLLAGHSPSQVQRALAIRAQLRREAAEQLATLRVSVREVRVARERLGQVGTRLRKTISQRDAAAARAGAARRDRAAALRAIEARLARGESVEVALSARREALDALLREVRAALEALAAIPDDEPLRFSELRGALLRPADGTVRTAFGRGAPPTGIVVAARAGEPVRAVARGRVVFTDWIAGLGLLLVLDHGDDYLTLYGHLRSLGAAVGDWVDPGEAVGTVGDSGGAVSSGLYFELRHGGKAVDPARWLASARG